MLDRAAALIEKRKAQIEKLDLLVKSRFVEMFGDPITNPRGWEIKLLGELGNLKNGMNYSQSDRGYKIQCLGVGDFGDLYEIHGIDAYSEINLSAKPANDYLLRNGDIVFVRSNGNRELVGRAVEVFPGDMELTFGGFCIRYRSATHNLATVYLNHLLHLPAMRKSLLKDGRGANIQNVNQQMLSALKIPVPPFDVQNHFIDFVCQVDKVKLEVKQSLKELERNYNSLMQKCFRGEIFWPIQGR